MRRFLLDTDHITLYRENNLAIFRSVAAIPEGALAVTIISFEEQVRGWLSQIQQATQRQNQRRLVWAYIRLQETLVYYARLAAIALANSCTVITRNRRDFERVPGLIIED